MAFLSVPHTAVKGIASCVPPKVDSNYDYPLDRESIEQFIATVGVKEKHIADPNVCSGDLCLKAAEKLIDELHWQKEEIQFLIFVTQTPDYITPATACVLQDKLGLSEECYAHDINLGCSGWVYGLSVLGSLVSLSKGKGLLLVGDTISKFISGEDKSTWMLFGDAGTATAVEFDETANDMQFHFATDGSGYDAIIIKDGAYRNPVTVDSFQIKTFGEGIRHNDLQLILDGVSVFTFGISKAPKSVKALIEHYGIDKESVDYYIFHQANMLMNETIRKKLKLDKTKVPYSLAEFGNTSGTSIPLTVNKLQGGGKYA